ncbi:MAG: hypothetical protein IKS92_09810, partial [Victivallales bacterium]|nr:hypothetical protein [Victivallales bacterium]
PGNIVAVLGNKDILMKHFDFLRKPGKLRILKGFVILKIILKSLYRKNFIECLKKLLQKTGLFSKAELEILFSIL